MKGPIPFSLGGLTDAWNRFFFTRQDLSICAVLRIAYGILLLVNVLVWWPDLEVWFGEQGALPFAASRTVVDADTLTLFQFLPRTDGVLWAAYLLLLSHIGLFVLGFFTRWQALFIFVWLTSFQHRNLLILDGEDYLFRLVAFLFIWLPAGHYLSLDRLRPAFRRMSDEARRIHAVWPLRLLQIQVTLVYVSSLWEKLRGEDWLNGTALYYVSRLDDHFGRFPVPAILFESLFVMKLLTWSVLVLECLIPLGLWFQETRRAALLAAAIFHLSVDYTMNLFLFHWLMMACLLAFVDGQALRERLDRFRDRWRGAK